LKNTPSRGIFFVLMKKIEHIGIAVKDLKLANEVFEKIFGKSHYKVEKVESEGVSTSFFQVGETKIELLEAVTKDSAIAKYIENRAEGIHHLAVEVDDIHAEMKRLKSEGFQFTRDEVFKGADNKLVCFIHPRTANGVLIELCQEIK